MTPTRRVVGVEDRWLQSRDAPNYFDAAWRARRFLSLLGGKPPDARRFALAVNPSPPKSGPVSHPPRLSGARRSALASAVGCELANRDVDAPRRRHDRLLLWALRTGRRDLAGVEPLRLAAQELADKTQSMSRLTLLVAQVRPEDDDELVILASATNVSGSLRGHRPQELFLDLAIDNRLGIARGDLSAGRGR